MSILHPPDDSNISASRATLETLLAVQRRAFLEKGPPSVVPGSTA